MTNFEKIKAMSVEEFYEEYFSDNSCSTCPLLIDGYFCACDEGETCKEAKIRWLESEVKND